MPREVKAMGLKVWIDRQLHPDRIAENPILLEKLKTLDTLNMTGDQLVRDYPTPQMVKQMVAGQMPFPTDPDKRMMIEKLVKRYEKQGEQPNPAANRNAPPDPAQLRAMLTDDQIRGLRQGTPEQRLAFFQTLPQDKQDDVVMAMPGVRQALSNAGSPELRRRIELISGPQQVVYRDLAEAKVLRAIYSNRQLEEQLDDFWFNHFNVFVGQRRRPLPGDRITSAKPSARTCWASSATCWRPPPRAPRCSSILDNWQSVGPNAPQPRGPDAKTEARA